MAPDVRVWDGNMEWGTGEATVIHY